MTQEVARPMTLNVRISGALSDYVARQVGADGAYENISEYVRDLIRRDREHADNQRFARLKAELGQAFTIPDSDFVEVDADTVIARNR